MVHVDIATAKKMVGLSKTSIYKLINSGDLVRVRILRRSYITRESLNSLLGISE